MIIKMRKIQKMTICYLIIFLMVNLTSCYKRQEAPLMGSSIITHLKNNKVYYLEWKIENLDKNKKLTFKDGNIINYKIRHIETNKVYSNEETKNKFTVVLNPGEEYIQKITLDELEDDGEYEGTFWAISIEGTDHKHIESFYKD